MKICISSGHGKYIRGASGYLDEVDEARKVVDEVAALWQDQDVGVMVFHDDVSTTQSENLDRIISWHNSKTRDLDISVHFNAYNTTTKPMGSEVYVVTQWELGADISNAMATAQGLPDRGVKDGSHLAFCNGTEMPACLLEVCFVDSSFDANSYNETFDALCAAIATAIAGDGEGENLPERPPANIPILRASGTVSWFGGPEDMGVAPDEGLAFIYEYEQAPSLFLPYQPQGTTGLARRLDPQVHYIAMRWDYDIYSKEMLASGDHLALVHVPRTAQRFLARPADWGPHEDTGRICDISQGLMDSLDAQTDDLVRVVFPAPRRVLLPPRPPARPELIPPPEGGGWGFIPPYGWGWFPQLRDRE